MTESPGPAAVWHLVKYQADVRRGETQNVGVVVRAGGETALRFLGQTDRGTVDGRRLQHLFRGEPEWAANYRRWVAYFERAAEGTDLDRAIARWNGATGSNYFIAEGGTLVDGPGADGVPALVQALYDELVADPQHVDATEVRPVASVERPVDRIFSALRITPRIEPTFAVEQEGLSGPISFDFEYRNGQRHLMDVLTLTGSAKSARRAANDFLHRAQLARTADVANSFIAFYMPPSHHDEELDYVMTVLERQANSVDLSDLAAAVETTGAILQPH